MIKKIGVLTSGGDAPGMNAAIRSVVRTATALGIEVYGVTEGYYGLYHDQIQRLEAKDVSGIILQGGTFLGSARFPEFQDEEIRKEAIKNLDKYGIQALIVIGGDGSYMGAARLSEMGYPCIGVPGTIDNDTPKTDFTIGFDTALNTITDAVDRLRDTSSSHRRCSVVEVMGRNAGDLALWAGIATGADFTIVPEIPTTIQDVVESIKSDQAAGRKHFIVILAEGLSYREELVQAIQEETGVETRGAILGHIQRGGRPTGADRVLASRMGSYAVELLLDGKSSVCVGLVDNKLVNNDIISAVKEVHELDEQLFKLANKYLNIKK